MFYSRFGRSLFGPQEADSYRAEQLPHERVRNQQQRKYILVKYPTSDMLE
jgi:hypothetical protein